MANNSNFRDEIKNSNE
jgi:hypothetical protein